jgi:hypothetical protein
MSKKSAKTVFTVRDNFGSPYDSDNFDYSSIGDSENLNASFSQDDPFESASLAKNYSTTSSLKELIDGISDNDDMSDGDTSSTNNQSTTMLHNSDSLDTSFSPDFSRPLSRNSTTSCLSTTATKDGIEGKRFRRHGPTTYSSNIIANMIHLQYQQQIEKAGHYPTHFSSPTPMSTPLRSSTNSTVPELFTSQMSINSTMAEFDGDSGDKKPTLPQSLPQITLKEKINLLNRE